MLRKRIISAVLSATLVAQPLTTYAADVISVPTDAQATVIVDGSDDGQQEQIETETAAAEVKTGYWFSGSMQLMLYDDGTYSMLEGDVYQSGNWIKGTGGVTLQYNGGERVVMLDGSGLAHSDGTIVWQLPTLVITVGDTVQPPSLGSGFTVSGGELDTSQTGDFNVQYTVTDEAIGKQFSLARTVTIQDVQVQTERPVVDYETEQPTTESEQPATEPETQIQEQPTTEPVVIGGEHADQETESKLQGSGFSKVFTVMTPGGTMTVSNSAGQLLATIEYGQSYTIDTVQNANDGIDDVTIELVAADGYVVDGLENLDVFGEVKAASWCPYMIGTRTFERGAYLTQMQSDEEYNAYFCQDGDFQYVDPNEFSLFAASSLDSAEVGTQFSGRATLISSSTPAGSGYRPGSGVISCTSGELSGHTFAMDACASGHNCAIPLAGQTGSYTATVTAIDRTNGSISVFIHWANDANPIGNYQNLKTNGTINHSFKGEIGVNKTSASTDARVTNSAYYSLANAEFTLYKNYDSNVYKVDVNADNCDAVPVVISTDNPERARIAIQKSDAETGEFKPFVQTLSFKDAVFGIYTDRECTDLVQQLTTDENGYAISDELLMRDYYVKEITAPTGYTLNSTVFTVTAAELKQNSEHTIKVVVPDRIIRANITLMKHISEDTGSIIQMPGNDLKGIKFVFTYVDDESIKFSLSDEENTIVTDEYGHATTADLEKYPYGTLIYGTWRISEVLPNGALEPIKDIELPVKEDGVDYPYVVNNDRVTSYLQIIKKDKETGNIIPISGVTFKIKTEANEYIKMWDYKTGAYVDQFSTDDSGTIRLPGALRYGNYSLEETSAPKGYKLGKPLAFAVTEGNKDPLKPITVVYEDDPVKGRILVQKLDAETNKEAGSGFVFSIAVKSDIKDAAGTIRKGTNKDGKTVELVAGTVVDEITTDEKGLATSKELQLGEYTVSEVKAGDYYSLGTVVVSAALTVDKPDVTVKVANYKTTFELSKLDSLDTMKVLPGITFKIFSEKDVSREKVEEYMQGLTAKRSELQAAMNDLISKNASEEEINELREENQKKLEEYKAAYGLALDGIGVDLTTDNEGYIRLQNLHHSMRYYATEIKTLDGYNLEPDVYSFDVDADGLVNGNRKYSMTITNTPNVLQITKTDATGEKELPGASLTLSKDGNTIESWISTEEPHVIKGLAPGTYKLEEIASPDGYCKAESIEFELTNTTEIQKVTMKDEYTTTEVSKLDSKTKNPVVGAKLALRRNAGNLRYDLRS